MSNTDPESLISVLDSPPVRITRNAWNAAGGAARGVARARRFPQKLSAPQPLLFRMLPVVIFHRKVY